jgi:hypothetical protein
MWRFGSDWLWEEGTEPPVELVDRATGEAVRPRVVDENTGVPIDVRALTVGPRRRD